MGSPWTGGVYSPGVSVFGLPSDTYTTLSNSVQKPKGCLK